MILVLLILFLPFMAFGAFQNQASCYLYVLPGTDRGTLVCYESEGSDGATNAMDQAECLKIKATVGEYLQSAYDSVDDLRQTYDNAYTIYADVINVQMVVFQSSLQNLRNYVVDTNEYYHVYDEYRNLRTNAEEAFYTYSTVRDNIQNAQTSLRDAIDALAGVSCPPNQTCTSTGNGSGTVTCECQPELQRLIDIANGVRDILGTTATNVAALALYADNIQSNTLAIGDGINDMIYRLNAPDDRMWGELQGIYGRIATNIAEWARTSISYGELLYDIRKLINGDIDPNNKLHLSSEGVISLYGTITDWVSLQLQQYRTTMFERIYEGYTNWVEQYYQRFTRYVLTTPVSRGWYGQGTTALTAPYYFDAFTNDSLTVMERYNNLVSSASGKATNWFQRVELYLMALNGWFSNVPDVGLIEKQDEQTEDGMQRDVEYATNRLSSASIEAAGLTNVVNLFVMPIKGAFTGIYLHPNLPTYVTLLPSWEIGGRDYGPVQFETSSVSDLIDLIRDTALMIWTLTIWLFYAVAIIGIIRIVVYLGVKVMAIAKDL